MMMNRLWLKSMERDELVEELKAEVTKGVLTPVEFENLLKLVYISMR